MRWWIDLAEKLGIVRRKPVDRERRAHELIELHERLEADPHLFDNISTPPLDADYMLVGKLIQVYCTADFNGRRMIDACRFIELGASSPFATQLNDRDVLLHLGRCATLEFLAPEMREGIAKAHSTIEMHHEHRNNLAHWAIRRIKREGVLAALTMSSNHRRPNVSGILAPQEARYGLFDPLMLGEELRKLGGHAAYLGKLAAFLELNASDIRQRHGLTSHDRS